MKFTKDSFFMWKKKTKPFPSKFKMEKFFVDELSLFIKNIFEVEHGDVEH